MIQRVNTTTQNILSLSRKGLVLRLVPLFALIVLFVGILVPLHQPFSYLVGISIAAILVLAYIIKPIWVLWAMIPISMGDRLTQIPGFPLDATQLAGVILVVGLLLRMIVSNNYVWWRSIFDGPMLMFMLVISIYSFGAFQHDDVRSLVAWVSYCVSYFVIFQLIRTSILPADFWKTLWVFIYSVSILVVINLVAVVYRIEYVFVFGQEIKLIHVHSHWNPFVRIMGLSTNPNWLVQLLVFSVPFLIFLVPHYQGVKRWSVLGLVAVNTIGLVMTQSRGAIVGFLIGFILIVINYIRIRKINKIQINRGVLILTAGVFIAIILGEYFVGVRNVILVSLSRYTDIFSLSLDEMMGDRFRIFRTALEIFLNNPLGHGQGASSHLVGNILGLKDRPVHSFYLAIGIEYGIPGLIVLCWLIFRSIQIPWRFANSRSLPYEYTAIGAGLFVGMMGVWVNNLMHSALGWAVVWVIFVLLAVYYVVVGNVLSSNDDQNWSTQF